jgi:hypothetical protein
MLNSSSGSVRFARASGSAVWGYGLPVPRFVRHLLALFQEDLHERTDGRGCLGSLLCRGPGFRPADNVSPSLARAFTSSARARIFSGCLSAPGPGLCRIRHEVY